MNAVTAGPEDGPAVILLHGFPEFWLGWSKQIQPLADAGFHVVAPDQRGYNKSAKPPRIADYRLSELTADVIAIADELGANQFCLAGHDWGAAVAWNVAACHPDRVRKLAILNVPHPAVMLRALRTKPLQMLRSWYLLFFQIPWLPELLLPRTDSLRRTSRPGTFSPEDLDRYREAWAQPHALTSMINWYRAALRFPPRVGRIQSPTRILWGVHDAFLVPKMAEESLDYCDRGELFEFPEATHWLQHEEPARVNELLITFFRESARDARPTAP